ncbi:MAG: hypothetical protein M3279_08640 [Actinomycetota bacterium]|nr:hypothetical protein [Actinomycetota bacterium]
MIERIAHSRTPQIAVGLVLVLFVGVAWWRFSDASELAEMTVKRRAGLVTVLRAGEAIEVGDSVSLKPRDVVQTHSSGEAIIRLEGGRLLSLAHESKIRVKDFRTVESQGGSLLVDAGDPLVVTIGGIRVTTPQAAFRIDRGVSVARVGSYDGRVAVSAPGEERLMVPALFEAAAPVNGALPQSPRPYDFDYDDPWDRLHLEDVLALQEQLDQLSGGLEAQIGRERPGLDYFAALEEDANVSFLRPYLKRDPINLLVGFTIARQDDRPLKAAFRQAFSLYDRGAEWAVAAAIMDVKLQAVIVALEDIATVAVVAASGGEDSFTAAAAQLTDSPGTEPPPGGGGNPPPPAPTDAPPTDKPPKPSDKPTPPSECQNFAECTAQDVADELNPDPTPTPKPKPTDDPDDGPLNILNGG